MAGSPKALVGRAVHVPHSRLVSDVIDEATRTLNAPHVSNEDFLKVMEDVAKGTRAVRRYGGEGWDNPDFDALTGLADRHVAQLASQSLERLVQDRPSDALRMLGNLHAAATARVQMTGARNGVDANGLAASRLVDAARELVASPDYKPRKAALAWARIEQVMRQLDKLDKKKSPKDPAVAAAIKQQLAELAQVRTILRDKAREAGNGTSRLVQAPAPVANLGRDYLVWGRSIPIRNPRVQRLAKQVLGLNQVSGLGQVLERVLRVLTGSTVARWAGLRLQQGQRKDSLRYAAGACIKGLANITGGISSLAGATVSFGEAVVANVGGGILRGLGAAGLAILSQGARALRMKGASDSLLGMARQLGRIPFLVKGRQTALPASMTHRVLMLEQLFSYTASTTRFIRAAGPLGNFEKVRLEDIPPGVLRQLESGPGIGLEFNPQDSTLSMHTWSGLKVGVYTEKDEQGSKRFILAFVGTKVGKLATLKADAVLAFGVEDPALRKANELVAAFKAQYPGQVELIGHSLGGALATWAGINNEVPVTTFNGLGLHVHMRDRLGAELLDKAQVININNDNRELLTQWAESRRKGVTASSQIGPRYVLEDVEGHSTGNAVMELARRWGEAPAA